MKQSIRTRFTALFGIFIAVMMLVVIMANTFTLELFYRNARVRELKHAFDRIDESFSADLADGKTIQEFLGNEELLRIIKEYSTKYNISIAMIDSMTNTALLSSERDGEILFKRIQAGMFDGDNNNELRVVYEDKNNKISIHKIHKGQTENIHASAEEKRLYEEILGDEMQTEFIESLGYLSDNQTMILMSTPVASLKESVNLSNRFIMYLGIGTVIIGLVIMYYLTRKITRPILELAEISERMGKLDFHIRYHGTDVDEIGVLGQNMNVMSQKLEATIQELKEANQKLQEDIQKKDEIDQMRRDFISNVSHELKTPIALIQGYAEGLHEGLCESEESRAYYTEVIIDEATKMNTMVKQLLALSALESGTVMMEMKEFDIAELTDGVVMSTSILLNRRDVKLVLEKSKPVFVIGDEFKIEEAITNMISNAIHHVTDGGEICVEVRKEKEYVTVSVYNTGKRIPEEDLKNLWEKFYKVDKAHSRQYGGSGIGLSIVRAIIEAHGGEVGVCNLEQGVKFWFTLGLKKEGGKEHEIDENCNT